MKPDINSGDRISCSKQTRSNSIKSLVGKKRLSRQFQMQQNPENAGATCGTNLFNTTAMLSGSVNTGHKPKAFHNNQTSVSQEMQWNNS